MTTVTSMSSNIPQSSIFQQIVSNTTILGSISNLIFKQLNSVSKEYNEYFILFHQNFEARLLIQQEYVNEIISNLIDQILIALQNSNPSSSNAEDIIDLKNILSPDSYTLLTIETVFNEETPETDFINNLFSEAINKCFEGIQSVFNKNKDYFDGILANITSK